MEYNIIGIDYSINSGAFCSITEDAIKLGSLYKSADSITKLMNKKDNSIKGLADFKELDLKIIDKIQISGEYHEIERSKLDNFIGRADEFFEMLTPYLTPSTRVFMEGLAYSSSGNSLIDISMLTILLRERLMRVIPSSQFYVFSPASIKKFAISGNAKKKLLFETLLLKEDKRIEQFQMLLKENQSRWIKLSGDVVAPCNDLIDSIWIALFGETFLKKDGKMPEKSKKSKK